MHKSVCMCVGMYAQTWMNVYVCMFVLFIEVDMQESVCMDVCMVGMKVCTDLDECMYVGRHAYACMYNISHFGLHPNLIENNATYRLNQTLKFTQQC